MEPGAIGELISGLGLPTFVIVALLRGWIVPAGHHAELHQQLIDERTEHATEVAMLREERNRWQQLALQTTGLAESVTRVVERRLAP